MKNLWPSLLTAFAAFAIPSLALPEEADPRVALSRVLVDSKRNLVDRRLGPPRRVTEGNNFQPFADRTAWEARARYLREKSLVAAGLWPLPEKCPLQATITGELDCGDYVVENVYFTSYPGFYVTASVYRPKGKGPFPAVLCAHGHAKFGRLAESQPLTSGGKPNPDPCPYQARGAGFARLGCLALLYDMVGYADAQQVRHPTDAPKVRVPEGTDDFEGLESEMYCLSTLGLQTWNSMRAVDYLLSRSDVAPDRIAITGGSGGATQTLMLMMTDDRIAAAAPVCMVSTGFQGDCTCEQAALGKIGTDTVEFSAAFAPKPLIVVGATGDWTKQIIESGGPEIRATYQLLGAADRLSVVRFEAPHNYNQRSREAVYDWFNRWLHVGRAGPIHEQPLDPLPAARLAVFTKAQPRPADAVDAAGLKRLLIESAEKKLNELRPTDAESLRQYQRIVGTALEHMVATQLPPPQQVEAESLGSVQRKVFQADRLLLSRKGAGEQVPAMLFRPNRSTTSAVVLVHPQGKAGLIAPSGEADALLANLLERGQTVLAIDPFLTGEYQTAAKATAPDPRSGFFPCFNRTLLAQRVHDILTAVAYLRGQAEVKSVSLVGLEAAGPWCLLARGLCGDAVSRTVVDVNGFSFRQVKEVDDPMYLPGALRYGDLAGLAPLAAPGELFLHDARDFDASWVKAAYQTVKGNTTSGRLHLMERPATTSQIVEWLSRQAE